MADAKIDTGETDGESVTSSRRPRPTLMTLTLTVALLALGGGLLLPLAATRPLLAAPDLGLAAVLALGVTLFVTELGLAHVEVHRQAYSYSMTGIPMLLGILYCDPQVFVAARIIAAALAFAVQRATPVKFAFNLASYFVDSALLIVISHLLLGEGNALTLRTAALCYVSLAVVDLLMSLLVLVVIRINQGPITRAASAEALQLALAFVGLNTAIGLIVALLLSYGRLGTTLLVIFLVATTVAYRGYLVLRRRHQSLQVVQDFIELSEEAGTVEELAERLMGDIRSLLRATRVELALHDDDGVILTRIVIDEEGTVTLPAQERRTSDRALARLVDRGEPVLITPKSSDAESLQWLAVSGARDALIVPLTRAGSKGTLVATDRLGDTSSFTHDDLALLQALAGHLAVSLRSTRLVERLRHEATHDVLTGLPNRALLTQRMVDMLDADTQAGDGEGHPSGTGQAAVLLLDLDRFKEVNDALGHHVGDQLLTVVADRLRELAIPGAMVSRLGGDEFAILLPPIEGALARAMAVADRVAVALHAPVDLPEVTVSTNASIGVSVAKPEHTHADLLRHADTAMYAAKSTGTRVTVYTEELDAGRADRLALMADLHLAIERDELEVYYQPKLDLTFDLVTGVEALVRWTHPTLGPQSPDVFIPLAESTGLVEQLTHVVLAKALRQCRQWQDHGLDLSVAVNLSARNVMSASLPDEVAAALVAAGLPAHKLILEITESSVMGDPERTVPTLERLAAIGVTLSLDDFGTGYSSLSYLQRLPVSEVKIDRSFVLGLTGETQSQASRILVQSIIGLGNSLGLRIVAEGVENEDLLQQLRELGCDVIQGYFVGKPMPGAELAASLQPAGLRTVGS